MKSTKEPLVGCPAGQPTHAVGQQPEGVLVESQRDQRVLDWLIAKVGVGSVVAECDRLAGQRRPYPSNLAKALGLTPPADLTHASPDAAKRHLAEFKSMLKASK